MEVLILEKAKLELLKFNKAVINKFDLDFKELQDKGKLDDTRFKKLRGYDLYELRVKHKSNIFRGICGYIKSGLLIVIFFQKKTQKTPIRFIEVANKRYKNFKDN